MLMVLKAAKWHLWPRLDLLWEPRVELIPIFQTVSLVHPQRGLCVMAYSCLHETSNFCPGFVEKGARTARSRAALQRCLRDAPVPDPACERPRKRSSEDRRKPWVRFPNDEECHTRLRREGTRRAHARLLSPQARACRIRREKRRGFKGDAPPLSEGVRT